MVPDVLETGRIFDWQKFGWEENLPGGHLTYGHYTIRCDRDQSGKNTSLGGLKSEKNFRNNSWETFGEIDDILKDSWFWVMKRLCAKYPVTKLTIL